MRVGFIRSLLWSRYGQFWQTLLEDVEAEVLFASQDEIKKGLANKDVVDISGFAFQLAAAEALALQQTDMIFVPDLNSSEDVLRGSGQDPWIASFPETLMQTLNALPSLVSVPASLAGNLETLAVNLLQTLARDASQVRRVWERHRSSAKLDKYTEPHWQLPSKGETVGLIGQPWLLNDAVVRNVSQEDWHVVAQHKLEPSQLRTESQRLAKRLIATDSEVLGAARLFTRKGAVTKLVMIADKSSGADAWLITQVKRLSHKPVDVIYLQDIFSQEDLIKLLVAS